MGVRLSGISSMAMRAILVEASAAWPALGGDEIVFESVGGVDAARRLREGERFDVVVLVAEALAELVASGQVVDGSVAALAWSPVGVAVPHGAKHPAIDSDAALLAVVLAAARIGCSTGPSGQALLALFERWKIAEQIAARIVRPPPGVPVGTLLARGEVDLGFQQLSELMHVDGIDVLGTLPAGSEIITTFSGGVCTASAEPAAARRLLAFLRSAAVDDARRRHGMAPARAEP
jgi:molybdate transport system substrate-binding protein